MNFKQTTVGIIGVGAMGGCILEKVVDAKLFPLQNIYIYDIEKNKTLHFKKMYGINVAKQSYELVKKSSLIILCVKPKEIEKLLTHIIKYLTEDKIVVSIAAGITISFIEKILAKKNPVIRVMPNINCKVGEGISAISCGTYVSEKEINLVQSIFSTLGETLYVEEKHLDAITALSGSGPAYFAIIIEALSDAGVKIGLPRNIATLLAVQTAFGTAKMIKEEKIHPAILKDKVTSPGGTTIAALKELEDGKLRATLIKAVEKAYTRARELSVCEPLQ